MDVLKSLHKRIQIDQNKLEWRYTSKSDLLINIFDIRHLVHTLLTTKIS